MTLIQVHFNIFLLYVISIAVHRRGIPDSISESYYLLGKQSWIFTVWLFAIGVICCFYGPWYMFASGIALCFTAAAARYKDDLTDTVHYIGAVLGYGFASIGINPWLYIPIALVIVIFKAFKISNSTWWIEIYVFLIIIYGLK